MSRMMRIVDLWFSLGHPYLLLFGWESVIAMSVIIVSLTLKLFCNAVGLGEFISQGMLFALPSLLQVCIERIFLSYLSDFTHFFILPFQALKSIVPAQSDDSFPLVTVRIAEMVIGRIDIPSMLFIVLAHFIGCIFGATLLLSFLPLSYQLVITHKSILY